MSNKQKEALEIMDRSVRCLALELPAAVWNDVNANWEQAKAALKEDDVKPKVFEVIDTVKAQYPASVFPDNGTSPDAQAGTVARLICDNIKREMEIMFNEEPNAKVSDTTGDDSSTNAGNQKSTNESN